MLFESERHEALVDTQWNESDARSTIERIAGDAARSFGAEALWPVHPLDLPETKDPLRMLYFGAAGVMWALDHLYREGVAEPPPDFSPFMAGLLEAIS